MLTMWKQQSVQDTMLYWRKLKLRDALRNQVGSGSWLLEGGIYSGLRGVRSCILKAKGERSFCSREGELAWQEMVWAYQLWSSYMTHDTDIPNGDGRALSEITQGIWGCPISAEHLSVSRVGYLLIAWTLFIMSLGVKTLAGIAESWPIIYSMYHCNITCQIRYELVSEDYTVEHYFYHCLCLLCPIRVTSQ